MNEKTFSLLTGGTHDPSRTISYVVMALYIAAFSCSSTA